jgi:hypothetical protein
MLGFLRLFIEIYFVVTFGTLAIRVLNATPNFNIKAGKNQAFFEKFFKINIKFINFIQWSANFFDLSEKEKN